MTLPLLHADAVPHVHELAFHPVTIGVAIAACVAAALIIRRRKA